MKLELQMTEEMREFLVYRGLHVLCTVNKEMKLTATHYAMCLVGGVSPMWGVWTVNNKFLRFFSRKTEIEDQYPSRVWRRVMAQWSMHDITDYPVAKRREMMQEYLEKHK
jgi:hypothetical protein